ncbi:unnamed protein product [Effrenium voratum]|nr:unnamed protein product [Effrenium voratum]
MSKKEAAQASVRSRAASPGATGAKAAKAKAGPAEGKPATPAAKSELEILEGLPPQLGALALGSLGLARAWAVGGSGAISSALSLAALLFLAIYSMKLLRPSALWRDASDASALPPLGAFFAAAQGVGVRYLVPELAQLVIVVTHGLMLLVSIRFAWVNAKKGLRPDPSWFPGLLLSGFTSVSASALGPWWLKAAVPLHFWSSIAIYVPVKLVVIYRHLVEDSSYRQHGARWRPTRAWPPSWRPGPSSPWCISPAGSPGEISWACCSSPTPRFHSWPPSVSCTSGDPFGPALSM